MNEERIVFQSGQLKLEGALHRGERDIVAVVLHPHPQYGGDMDNHVVRAVCDALARGGASTLRFNTRGTGRSEGAFDNARGEQDDLRAAVAHARATCESARTLIAGYSFGAGVASRAAPAIATGEALDALILISPPAQMVVAPPDDVPALLITGSDDSIAPPNGIAALASDAHSVVTVEGADHGWWPGVDELAHEITSFVNAVFGAASSA
jgi:alpha/beta superfamily hydrolase